jgi:hypothetical protein
MKRLILTSLIAVGAVMAQTGAPAATPATPAAPKSQTQATPKPAVKRHNKKAKKSTAAPTVQAPAAKVSK